MRKVMEMQLKIGQVNISEIKIDLSCRDEIPQLLLGLQAIDSNIGCRNEVFEILKGIIPMNVDVKNGRPGMDLWKILVLGTLRLSCNWDYDKLHNISNEHKTVREFLGHTVFDFDQRYSLQTLKDNIKLFTPEILDKINQVVVKLGHDLMGGGKKVKLKGRCDSFVVETDVHYPTDINILLDAIRKVVFLIGRLCGGMGVSDWRQYRHIFKKIRRQFHFVRRLKHSASKNTEKRVQRKGLILDAHRQYIDLVDGYVKRAKAGLDALNGLDMLSMAKVFEIEKYIAYAQLQIDQIRRRVIEGETIAHNEKVFSIFEEHTEWISKGKAGVPQELGLGVCVLEDQYGFILHHKVMENERDVDIAIPMVAEAKMRFPELKVCSFDKGFYSSANRSALGNHLEAVVLPKKGKLSEDDKKIEGTEVFVEARKKHSAIESAINALENHGLDRCLDHGLAGFKRYVALAVLARNIQRLGALIRERELEKQRRKRKLAA